MKALLVDLDGVLGDTRPLWHDWLAGAARLLPVDPASLPDDRAAAAAELDRAGAGNWRALLERFAEDRAAVYLRPNADANAALSRLVRAGTRVFVFTDAPGELARIALGQLGAARRIDAVAAGADSLERLRAEAGVDATVVRTREQLEGEAAAYTS